MESGEICSCPRSFVDMAVVLYVSESHVSLVGSANVGTRHVHLPRLCEGAHLTC